MRQLGINRREALVSEMFIGMSYIVGPPTETTKCAVCGETIISDYIDIGNPPKFTVCMDCVKEIIKKGVEEVCTLK